MRWRSTALPEVWAVKAKNVQPLVAFMMDLVLPLRMSSRSFGVQDLGSDEMCQSHAARATGNRKGEGNFVIFKPYQTQDFQDEKLKKVPI